MPPSDASTLAGAWALASPHWIEARLERQGGFSQVGSAELIPHALRKSGTSFYCRGKAELVYSVYGSSVPPPVALRDGCNVAGAFLL